VLTRYCPLFDKKVFARGPRARDAYSIDSDGPVQACCGGPGRRRLASLFRERVRGSPAKFR